MNFLTEVIETAKQGIQTFDGILQLQKQVDERLSTLGNRARDAKKVMNQLYMCPITDVGMVENTIQKSKVSAYKLIGDLEGAEQMVELIL